MSLDDFQLIDNEPIEKSIIKGEFLEIFHQQGAQLNDQLQKIEFISGENKNHHQVGNSYLEFNISVRHPMLVSTITLKYDSLILVLLSVSIK